MANELLVVGLSHRTASVDVREKLAIPEAAQEGVLRDLLKLPSIGEAMLISTCNRVEVYAVTRAHVPASGGPQALAEVREFLASVRGYDPGRLSAHVYEHLGPAAVKHVFRVASSLDSLVIGESQILGQLKTAFGGASQAGSVGPLLGRCVERAFGVAKRVRSETAISRGGANVSSVAVELARKIFGELTGKRVLVVGAGKMSDLAARHLDADGVEEILVTNRSPEKAEELAKKVGGIARPWAELEALIVGCDIVISSTGSTVPILTRPMMKSVMKARRHRPLFLIDIAVPRDVEPSVAKLDGVYLFDIDDLEKVVAGNLEGRTKEAGAAERIVEAETAQFLAWLRSQGVVPTIKDLRERFSQIARGEAEKALATLGVATGSKDEEAIRYMADAIVNKLLHTPLMALKKGDAPDVDVLVAATRRLFALSDAATTTGEVATVAAAAAGGTAAAEDPEQGKEKKNS